VVVVLAGRHSLGMPHDTWPNEFAHALSAFLRDGVDLSDLEEWGSELHVSCTGRTAVDVAREVWRCAGDQIALDMDRGP
jgi:hypothetical protein